MIDKDVLVDLIGEEKLYTKYFEPVNLNKLYTSPFRKDRSPGCRFVVTDFGIKFYDNRANLYYDAFNMAMVYFKETNFFHCLKAIMSDFNLTDKDLMEHRLNCKKDINKSAYRNANYNSISRVNKSEKIVTKLVLRNYKEEDLEFWNTYGITKKQLLKYGVRPVSKFSTYDNNVYKIETEEFNYKIDSSESRFMYALLSPYGKNPINVKFYRPYGQLKKQLKWMNYLTVDTLFGYEQLPKKGDTLIITSSFKDMMMFDHCGFNSVSPNSEVSNLNPQVINSLKKRFKNIIVCYDNDATGIKWSEYNAKKFGLISLQLDIPTKDPSDYYAQLNNHDLFVEQLTNQVTNILK